MPRLEQSMPTPQNDEASMLSLQEELKKMNPDQDIEDVFKNADSIDHKIGVPESVQEEVDETENLEAQKKFKATNQVKLERENAIKEVISAAKAEAVLRVITSGDMEDSANKSVELEKKVEEFCDSENQQKLIIGFLNGGSSVEEIAQNIADRFVSNSQEQKPETIH